MMKNITWELVLDCQCELGEGPVWDEKQNRIFWIDILSGDIHYYHPGRKEHKMLCTGQTLGCIAFKKSGGLIAAIKDGFATIDVQEESISVITKLDIGSEDIRFNDGKCDPAGRFWAGTMSISGIPKLGILYAMENDYCIKTKIEQVGCSNGLAWSPDLKTLYYIDTPTRQVAAYAYEQHSGRITKKRTVVEIHNGEGYPDGMTIDSEGMLWVALWGGWKVVRFDPSNGRKLVEIQLPVSQVTCCVFGGETLEDIYITSAKTGLSSDDLKKQPLAGSLFVVKNCGYRGMRGYEFNG